MHYTDDVLREFFAAIRDEPWFDNTVVVIIGDHGENLGEHDGTAAQRNGWRETVWVPLIIHGRHPRLPTGFRSDVAGMLEVAPTLADLAGSREATTGTPAARYSVRRPGAWYRLPTPSSRYSRTPASVWRRLST